MEHHNRLDCSQVTWKCQICGRKRTSSFIQRECTHSHFIAGCDLCGDTVVDCFELHHANSNNPNSGETLNTPQF
jgi:hypothetical protein